LGADKKEYAMHIEHKKSGGSYFAWKKWQSGRIG
jgi:hypothetical protein